MAKDFFGNEITLGDTVAFMQTGYRQLVKGTVIKITNNTLILSHPATNVGKIETKQDSSQVIVNKKMNIIDVISKIFDDHISAEVGDHFGSPSAHISGREDFFNELKTFLE